MKQIATKSTPRKTNEKTKDKYEKQKRAQEEGAFSNIATSHTSKSKILKSVKRKTH